MVITRTREEDAGCKLTYDVKGELIRKQIAPRPVGTTVIVDQLFKVGYLQHFHYSCVYTHPHLKLVLIFNL